MSSYIKIIGFVSGFIAYFILAYVLLVFLGDMPGYDDMGISGLLLRPVASLLLPFLFVGYFLKKFIKYTNPNLAITLIIYIVIFVPLSAYIWN